MQFNSWITVILEHKVWLVEIMFVPSVLVHTLWIQKIIWLSCKYALRGKCTYTKSLNKSLQDSFLRALNMILILLKN